MKTVLKVAFVGLTLMGSIAMAGDSGCGLGSLVIQRNSKLLQLFSLTTNASFFSQGFGITSGTSGCSANNLVQNEKEIQYFVEVNQDDLNREMAQGNGAKLQTLAALHGCTTNDSMKAFGTMTQKSYEKLVPQSNTPATELVGNLRNEVMTSGVCEQAKVSSL